MYGMIVRRKYGRKLYRVTTGYGRTAVDIETLDGRNTIRVHKEDLVPVSTGVEVVNTLVGPVKVPRGWLRYPSFSGSSRRTYVGRKWVFKVPHGDWGAEQNRLEAARWALQSGRSRRGLPMYAIRQAASYGKKGRNVPVAECYLLGDGTLMMERVKPLFNLVNQRDKLKPGDKGYIERSELPRWVNYVDSDQVGLNRYGKLVAYDI